ncbi:ATP-dependent Clp protease ATP-binding subunit [Xylocopilactobacillus apicola]|uniref:ATP-dependent Clp protease ATP-binding subunit n=1 Tax=Xylocopilactobacillus apicola TaxID=2932184 RepID=A0AAU9D510_9LACO|nr:ATP-dependent Clp protease ATP-binding subunit [Xylocopilactobacillus apicola]BDR58854.1 ATP-dependent Clp protease ATP-binding subunit [Xylocopilactobacillus apicola]
MICQNCKQRPATIHLFANREGQKKELDLCQFCYQQLKEQQIGDIANSKNFDPSNLLEVFFKESADNGAIQNNVGNPNDSEQSFEQNDQSPQQPNNNLGRFLGKFGVDLTEQARVGKIDPVIGRDKEISRVIEILNRRTKNNPVLIGEAGVGKTAVVEGLAERIAEGKVPQKLRDKKIVRLDVVSLVQGTGIRGQFEQRMQQLIDELKSNRSIILFIDEIHEIVGAGNAEGGMDAGNVLKPALSRGDLQIVGATTSNEYRSIEKDSALARRLQAVMVSEPTVKESIKILQGLQKRYEDYHHVHYSEKSIEAAVELSSRYIQDRFLPDKAIDLMDESGSQKNLLIDVVDPQVIQNKIQKVEEQKNQALREEDYEKAAYYRDQVTKLKDAQKSEDQKMAEWPEVTVRDIEKIVEKTTNIPVGELQSKEQQQLKTLAVDLKKKVIGQDEAVDKVARAIRRNRIGFNKSGRPIGSFLFVGPTGVGKTELAKQLAKTLFGTENSMIRFDMSEYMEKFSVSKLIGSPPGYVGYEEAGQLTERVRRNPYSLILLDEVEKAHPDVLNMFLQILDDGRLTDSKGRTVSFKDTIIIMTSNAGQGTTEASVGFGASKSGSSHSVLNQLSDYFKPEFLNRFDDIVEFQSLSKTDLLKIVNIMLNDTNADISNQGISIHVTDPAKEKIVELGYDPKMGARPLRRVIQEQVEDKVADFYLDHPQNTSIEVRVNSGNIVVNKSEKS